ncbi:hypothetical protein NEH60_21845, partial [Xanthomonas hortorum pv. pelargonii]|uniref:hypothetical protein n=1 Tax=Xanthomonas hortorum TaxID=56454 RepID=UPI0020448AD2
MLRVFFDVHACCDATYRHRNARTAIGLMRSAQPKKELEYGENIAIDQRGTPRCTLDHAHDGQSIECSS